MTDDRGQVTVDTARSAVGAALSGTATTVKRRVNRLFASDALVIVTTLAVALLVGAQLVGTDVAALAFVAGVGMALAVVLANSSNPLIRLIGGAVTVGAAVLAVAPLTLTVALVLGDSGFGVFAGLTVLWLVLASFAAATVPTSAPGDGTVRTAGRTVVLAGIGIVLVVGVRLVPETGVREQAVVAAGDAVGAAVGVIVHPGGGDALVSMLALVAVTALVVRWGLGKLPIERFLPPERRASVASGLTRIRSRLRTLFRLSMLSTLVAGGVALLGAADVEGGPEHSYTHVETIRTELPAPAGDIIADLVLAPTPRWAMLVACALAVGVGVVEVLRLALRRGLATVLARLFAPVVGGAVVTVVAASLIADPDLPQTLAELAPPSVPPSVIQLVFESPAFVAAGLGLLVALGVLWGAFTFVSVLGMVRILPKRATGVSLASIALFGTAITAALVGRATLAVATAVAALFVWDVGEFGVGLREELPAGTPTFRVEIVHAGTSALAGVVVAAGTLWAHARLSTYLSVPDPRLALVALVAAAVVTALVSFSLRG